MNKRIRTAAFCGIFLILFNTFQSILTPYWKYETNVSEGEADRIHLFYQQEQDSLDYIVLGVSHSFYSVNPMQIYAESGITGFNLGSSDQPISVSYYWLKEACKTQSPQWVFFDVRSLFHKQENILAARISKALIYMHPSLNKLEAMWNCKAIGQSFWELAFPLLQFHDRWSSLSKSDWNNETDDYFLYGTYLRFSSRLNIGKDFLDLNHTESYNMVSSGDVNSAEIFQNKISEGNRDYFEKILSLCQQKDICFIPTKFPSMNWTENEAQQIQSFLSEYELELLDLNNTEGLDIDWEMDTADDGYHTNYWGATKTSSYLAAYMSAYRTGDVFQQEENRISWEQNLKKYLEWEQGQLMESWQKTYAYLETLSECKDKYITVITAADEASGAWNGELEMFMKKIGVQSSFYNHIQDSFIAVIDGDDSLFEKWGQSKLKFFTSFLDSEDTSHRLSVVSAGLPYYNIGDGMVSSVIVDGIEYCINRRGLNLVVIDKEDGAVVSSVCIDTHLPALNFQESMQPGIKTERWENDYIAPRVLSDHVYQIVPLGNENCAVGVREDGSLGFDTAHKDFPDQQFRFTETGSGVYLIYNENGEYLTVENGGSTAGAGVILRNYTGLASQKWFPVETRDGVYRLISLYNGLALDIPAAIAVPGADIRVWTADNPPSQEYRLRDIQ